MNLKNRIGEIIEMIYVDKSGNFSQRKVKIISVADNYLKAYCYRRRCVRIFALENILSSRICA
ncbi:putative DNA-binding transcriptional regulator YafY [Scopulibacillus daqui]|uniref:DNA-binding transcriptional regulator YafY n=1 Tax=Scopulibacillus daqui TaxID=1469162 RepID=A0ABS2PYG8_9BACL|nr:putative DNA-binding transcriptional regulator YafY [Scopulibacillus daqui]